MNGCGLTRKQKEFLQQQVLKIYTNKRKKTVRRRRGSKKTLKGSGKIADLFHWLFTKKELPPAPIVVYQGPDWDALLNEPEIDEIYQSLHITLDEQHMCKEVLNEMLYPKTDSFIGIIGQFAKETTEKVITLVKDTSILGVIRSTLEALGISTPRLLGILILIIVAIVLVRHPGIIVKFVKAIGRLTIKTGVLIFNVGIQLIKKCISLVKSWLKTREKHTKTAKSEESIESSIDTLQEVNNIVNIAEQQSKTPEGEAIVSDLPSLMGNIIAKAQEEIGSTPEEYAPFMIKGVKRERDVPDIFLLPHAKKKKPMLIEEVGPQRPNIPFTEDHTTLNF